MPPAKSGSERHGQPIGGAEHPHHQPAASPRPGTPPPACAVPGCRGHPRTARPPHPALGGRRAHRTGQPGPGLPFHHRAHHRGLITITGPADDLEVTDTEGADSAPDPWPAHPTAPDPRSRPTAAPPANAPTGGGTNPSNHNHHQAATRPRCGCAQQTAGQPGAGLPSQCGAQCRRRSPSCRWFSGHRPRRRCGRGRCCSRRRCRRRWGTPGLAGGGRSVPGTGIQRTHIGVGREFTSAASANPGKFSMLIMVGTSAVPCSTIIARSGQPRSMPMQSIPRVDEAGQGVRRRTRAR